MVIFFKNPKNIFKKYVNDLYKLRQKYSKGDPMNLTCKLLMNSLFVRFAMKQIINTKLFLDKEEFLEISKKFEIDDIIDLDDNGLFVSYIDNDLINKQHKISISIASAVTSYARIFMSKFKNNPNIRLYYTDTDSIFIDSDLSDDLVNNEIGNFKLENIFKEIVFLGPKLYCGITEDNKVITKIKGFKNSKNLNFSDFVYLLNKDASLQISHDKWYRSLSDSQILIKNQFYNLMKTENKRKILFDENNKAFNTEAFKI